MLGYAQVLERDPAIPPRRIDAIKIVRRNAEHLSGLIDGLLDISKIEAGRFHLDRHEVRIREHLDQMVDMFRLQAAAKNIDFVFHSAGNLPAVVFSDENRLRQVLINLLSNAIKFTETGHVALRVNYRNQVATIVIEDSGIGVDDSEIERIFQPFERAQNALTKGMTGTGLGLTITKMLVETMGGEIAVRSKVGSGSTFTVKLLLAEVPRPRNSPVLQERVNGYAGPRQTVLVVDDDDIHRDLVHELLTPLGFNVIEVPNGEQCLDYVSRHPVNLVLLDISMPVMDGWAVAKELRTSALERPAIVFLSANALDRSRVLDERDLVYDGYLMKPIDLRQLLEIIHTLLDIEWTYAAARDPRPPFSQSALSAANIPEPRVIDELIRLGQIGHLRGIQDKLVDIESSSSTHNDFVAQMRTLVDALDLKRYVSVLEALRSEHAQ
jgi:CheY-like chemotaxis protein